MPSSIEFSSFHSSLPVPIERHRGPVQLAVRIALAGLLTAVAFAGCSAGGVTSGTAPGVNSTALTPPGVTSASNPDLDAATPTQGPAKLQPPAAPTGLHEWVDESSDPVPAYFEWTAPPGPISGYYIWKKGVYVDTPPPAICGPTWTKLPASATTLTMESVESEPSEYICAFNDAGTSPTVQFPPDTPWVPTEPVRPDAPFNLAADLVSTGGTYPAEELAWASPLQPVSGYYLDIYFGGGDIPAPEACDRSWTKVAASPRTYKIPAVEQLPSVFICAFNDAGMSPMVKFPTPDRG
ncbi:MAG: hypothetical protein ABSC46_07405 [Candidatus Limnocylindrales bacterium]